MAAEFCDIHDGDTVAVFGAGSVGQFAARSALLLGAGKVILLDRLDYRLNKAARDGITIVNYERHGDVFDLLRDMTDGIGPDAVIDAVGMEAHGSGLTGVYDTIKQTLKMENDRPTALRWAIQACRKGGTISVPGVYSGYIDKFPMGTFFSKALTMRGGQAPVHKYMAQLLQLILDHKIQPSEVITHRIKLDEAPEYYQIFREKKNDCLKAVIHF
jgi:threonine dehydrogenase-like Zn-dependent dehydrogenase